jgi:hypothetical protein
MRPTAVVALLACAACSRAPQPEAPAPVSAPAVASFQSQPAALPTPSDGGLKLDVCVVRNGRLETVTVPYEQITGDTTAPGKRPAQVFGDSVGYAEGATWFIRNEPIALAGRRFEKYGMIRVIGPADVAPVGEYQGVTVFAEPANAARPSIVYLPVRRGCEFQPYMSAVVTSTVRGL